MLHFIVSNAATIVISALLAAAVVAIVAGGVRKLLRGQGFGCACGYDACDRACARGARPHSAPKTGANPECVSD